MNPDTNDIIEMAQQRIEMRKQYAYEQHQATPKHDSRLWRYAFLGTLLVLTFALLFTPGLSVEEKMILTVQGICAQEHNIILGGIQLPICARCSGIYISTIITVIYAWTIGRGRAGRLPKWSISATLAAFVVLMAIDGFNSFFNQVHLPTAYEPTNELRVLTGLGMGVGMGVVMLMMLNMSLRADVDADMPILGNWREFITLLLITFLVMVAIFGNVDLFGLFAWPFAIMGFLGIIGVMFCVCLLLVAMMLNYENRITRFADLARPATLALIPTLLIIGALSLFRFWLEAQGLMN
ncbi:MAG: DUF2085 domain-containing protein [Chloroflexaceae bacterium]|nr:DUF2085 domain-containing protein [Chloroflexaceae bacterium]